eukprot:TRINITY_DN11605_c0_g1_i1.p1 TRINITY_DN11605_c0_g1~~TRINITY_DN11605_c0_g1_i1.p1  ORF type:complete len:1921 (+),score=728.52 TRINITY_DN11605_c0_g1_i1:174-5936(+)
MPRAEPQRRASFAPGDEDPAQPQRPSGAWEEKEKKGPANGLKKKFADGSAFVRLDDIYALTGNYFCDLDYKEREAVVIEATLRTHPDTVLREAGIIRQAAKYRQYGFKSQQDVVFDAKSRRWVYSTRATPHKLDIPPSFLTNRKDHPPHGIIRVVGEIDFEAMRAKAGVNAVPAAQMTSDAGSESHSDTMLRKRAMCGFEELIDEDDFGEDETTGLGEAGDVDATYMSYPEVAKHIKQYLSRAIPSLLVSAGLLVVHRGTGSIAHHLSKGMAMFELMDPDDEEEEEERGAGATAKHHRGACMSVVPFKRRHDVHQHFTHSVLLSPQDGETISDRDTINFINRLIESLCEGHTRGDGGKRGEAVHASKTPPPRAPVPCCTVLVGGDPDIAPMELMQAVTRRDSVLVVKGSGKYADVLCSIIDAVQEYNPQAGLDDFQRFMGTADALTEQIVMTYVAFRLIVVEKGMKVEDFQRNLHGCLRGDETLYKAWHKYAQWRLNEDHQAWVYWIFNVSILIVSLLATFVSVLLTFILMLWAQQGKTYVDDWWTRGPTSDEWLPYMLYFSLTWAVMGFPIILALLQAVNNKVNPASKWVALRVASEDVLRQIYMYRTRTLDYSNEKVKEHTPGLPGYTPKKGKLVYSTRAELLAMRINQNSEKLSLSPVANVALSQYTGALPPKDIRVHDPGYHDLSPDEYIDVRLRTKRAELQVKSAAKQRRSAWVERLERSFSVIGMCLAGVAATGHGYLEAWIAFTTAVISSCQRYADFSNLSKLHEQYNKTDNNLSNVEMWFAKLGETKDTRENHNQLVKRAEDFILEEVQTWARLLQSIANKVKEVDDREEQRAYEDKKQKEKKEVDKLKDMGLDGLSQANLMKVLEDPQSEGAKKVYFALSTLNEDLVPAEFQSGRKQSAVAKPQNFRANIAHDTEDTEAAQAAAATAATHQAVAEQEDGESLKEVQRMLAALPTVPKAFAEAMSAHNLALLLHKLLTKTVSTAQARSHSYHGLLHLVGDVPTVGPLLTGLGQREFFECVKGCLLFTIMTKIFAEMPVLKAWDLIPCASDVEDFLHEMYTVLVRTHGIIPEESFMVLAQIREEQLRDKLMKVPEEHARQFLGSLAATLREVDGVTSQRQPPGSPRMLELGKLFQYLANCCHKLAEMDIARVMDDVDERIILWKELAELPNAAACALETLNREELLDILPERFREMMSIQSVVQCALAIKALQAGTPSSRLFESLKCHGDVMPWLENDIFLQPDVRERFILASLPINQRTINMKNKGELVRTLKMHRSFNSDMGVYVHSLSEKELQSTLSAVQALQANSYSGRVLDRLDDLLTMFDVTSLLNVDDREKLVDKLVEFQDVGSLRSVQEMSKERILSVVGFPSLQKKLGTLSQEQLRELTGTLLSLLRRSRRQRIWQRFVEFMRSCDSGMGEVLAMHLSPETIDHMFTYAQQLDLVAGEDAQDWLVPELEPFRTHATSQELLQFIGDSLITSALDKLHPRYIVELMLSLRRTYGDLMISDICELTASGMQHAGKLDQYEKFAEFFLTGCASVLPPDLGEADTVFYQLPQERRHKLVEGLMSMCLTEVRDLSAQAPGEFLETLRQGRDPNLALLIEELTRSEECDLDAVEIQDVVVNVFSELVVSMPYRIFVQTCNTLRMFNLRDVVRQLAVRYVIPVVMYYLMAKGLLTFNAADNRWETQGSRAGKETRRTVANLIARELRGRVEWGEQIDKCVATVRFFTPAQFEEFCTCLHGIFTGTAGGRFFAQYCGQLVQKAGVKGLFDAMILNLGVNMLKNRMRTPMGYKDVLHVFSNWDVRKFVRSDTSKKRRKLFQMLEDEQLVALFCKMNEKQMDAVVAHLRLVQQIEHDVDDGVPPDETLLISGTGALPEYDEDSDEDPGDFMLMSEPPEFDEDVLDGAHLPLVPR